MVPGDQKFAPPLIPNGQSKNSVQLLKEFDPILFIQVKQDLRIATAPKSVSLVFKVKAMLLKVVKLSVVSKPDAPVTVSHRLMTGRGEVDYCQSPMPESDAGTFINPSS